MILLNKFHKKNRTVILFHLLTLSFNLTFSQDQAVNFSDKEQIITLSSWLVSNPMPGKYYLNKEQKTGLQDGYSMDFLEIIGGEKSPKIILNNKFQTPDGKFNSFFEHKWKNDYLDLKKLFGSKSEVFTYLYVAFKSNKNQKVFLHVGTNDAGKVWANGKLLINYPTGRRAEPSQNIVPLTLNKGMNTILLKIDQLGGEWGAYVQIYNQKAQNIYDNKKNNLQAQSSKNAQIIETKVIWKQENRYIGWPSITKTSSGELLAVFSGNRDAHVCPYGIVQMIRSSDKGETWSQPETINNTPLDDRDAGILETNSGTWLVNWFTSMAFDTEKNYAQHPEWIRHREKLSDKTIDYWLGNWTRRSIDKGKTWEEPVKQLVSSPHGPIELMDGRLLYVGTGTINGNKQLAVEDSKDDGKQWNLIATMNIPKEDDLKAYSEPHVVELSKGKLLAMFRYNSSINNDSFLRQTESNDGGKTWTTLHKTKIWGYPPHLLQLNNGWILLSYGVRKIPYSERVCISKDGGKSWDIENEIILSFSDSGDLGYPASIQLDDGSILTIYYQIDKVGEKTSLMQTHWKLKSLSK